MKRFLHVLFGLLLSVLPLAAQEINNGTPVYVVEIVNGVPTLTGAGGGGGGGPSTDTIGDVLARGTNAAGYAIINLGSLIPSGSNTVDLGSLAKPWRSLYAGGHTIYLDGVPMFSVTNGTLQVAYPIANTDSVISNLTVQNMLQLFGYAVTNVNTNTVLLADGSEALTGSLLPAAANSVDLGSLLFPYRGMYVGVSGISSFAARAPVGLSGANNTAAGEGAGTSLLGGINNTILGKNAAYNLTAGNFNVIIGNEALYKITANGSINTAIGDWALHELTNGNYNTAIGAGAMKNVVMGSDNHAIGPNIMADGVVVDRNIGIGYAPLRNLRYGTANIALGEEALRWVYSNAADNVSIGQFSMWNLGQTSSTNSRNTALGSYAGYNLTSGEGNIYLGYYALGSSATVSNEFVAGGVQQPIRNVYFGAGPGSAVPWTFHGEAATINASNLVIGANGSFIVTNRLGSTTFAVVPPVNANGGGAGMTIAGTGAGVSVTNADNVTLYGAQAGGGAAMSGVNNTFLGAQAGYSTTSGGRNTFVGQSAGYLNTVGIYNTFLGKDAGQNFDHTTNVIAIGINAGANGRGLQDNIIMGRDAVVSGVNDTNKFVAGSDAYPMLDVYFGGGPGSTKAWTLNGQTATFNASNIVVSTGGSVMPASSNTIDIGSQTMPFRSINASNFNVVGSSISFNGVVTMTATGGQVQVAAPIVVQQGTNAPLAYAYSNDLAAVGARVSSMEGSTGNWSTAYGWGNHATAGYAGTGTVSALTTRVGNIEAGTNNWNTAYGWGNHASAGYAKLNATNSGNLIVTNSGVAFGTTDTSIAKLYVTGEAGPYTNKPLVRLNRSTGATGNILEWGINGGTNGYVDVNGNLVAPVNTPIGLTNTFNGVVKLATNGIAWDDMLSGTLQIRTSGGVEATWNDVLCGVQFTTGATTSSANDHVTVTYQTPHRRKSGTELHPHVHFWQTAADQTNMWYIQYAATGIGSTNVVDVYLGPAINQLPYTPGTTMHQLAELPEIPGAGLGISSIVRIKLYRNGAFGTGSVTATDVDIHYQIDSLGSDAELSKSF